MHVCMQASRGVNRGQAGKQAGGWTGGQAGRPAGWPADRQADEILVDLKFLEFSIYKPFGLLISLQCYYSIRSVFQLAFVK